MIVSLQNKHYYNFNSIKVQLEHTFKLSWESKMIFQFHKGTIRTNPIWNTQCITEISIP